MNDPDLDAEFERIIAGWDTQTAPEPQQRPSAPDGVGSEPAPTEPADPGASADPGEPAEQGEPDELLGPAATHDEPTTQSAPPTDATQAPAGAVQEPPSTPADAVWRGATVPDARDEVGDEHFDPPTVTDLPTAEDDPMFWAIVGGLTGGPLLLLYVLLFDRGGSAWWVVTALTLIIVGFVLLVLRGGTERDPTDDGTRI